MNDSLLPLFLRNPFICRLTTGSISYLQLLFNSSLISSVILALKNSSFKATFSSASAAIRRPIIFSKSLNLCTNKFNPSLYSINGRSSSFVARFARVCRARLVNSGESFVDEAACIKYGMCIQNFDVTSYLSFLSDKLHNALIDVSLSKSCSHYVQFINFWTSKYFRPWKKTELKKPTTTGLNFG